MTNKEIGSEIKKLRERLEVIKPVSREEQFRQDILKYFLSKTEPYAIPECVLMEIIEYINYSTTNYIRNEFDRYIHSTMKSQRVRRGTNNGGN